MDFLTLVELTGFFFGVGLYTYLFSAILRGSRLHRLEYLLLALLSALLLWYGGNFLSLLLRQLDVSKVGTPLRIVEVSAFLGLALLPGLLLHNHWVFYRRTFSPTRLEVRLLRPALWALYLSWLFIPVALSSLLDESARNPFDRLGAFTVPFLALMSLSYYLCAFLQWRILKRSSNSVEGGLFRRLFPVFLLMPLLNLFVFLLGGRELAAAGPYWEVAAKLSSLLPSLMVAYYIYYHQFLQIVLSRSIPSAILIAVVLGLYWAGVRRLDAFLQENYQAPPLLVEGVFLAFVLLFFPPISRRLEERVARLFGGRLRRYRKLGEAIQKGASEPLSPRLLADLVVEKLQLEFPASRVSIQLTHVVRGDETTWDSQVAVPAPPDDELSGAWGDPRRPATAFYPLRSGGKILGYLGFDSPHPETSTADREALLLLANEIATALERSQLLESKLRVERELARKSHLEDLGRTAAAVAHNVKNPLSSMKTLLQLLGEAHNLDDEQRREIGMMVGEVDRLSSTITQLLRFSRLETDRGGLSLSVVRLSELVESVHAVFRGDLESGRIRFEWSVIPEDAVHETDPDVLKEVLGNLISNAIEACSQGDMIAIRASLEEEGCRIDVVDSGPGVPPGVKRRLFEPFVTTKSRGTGLGLAIVRKRVEQLGGEIRAIDAPQGKGACFRIVLSTRSRDVAGAK